MIRIAHLIVDAHRGGMQRLVCDLLIHIPETLYKQHVLISRGLDGNYLNDLSKNAATVTSIQCWPFFKFSKPYRLRRLYKIINAIVSIVKLCFFINSRKIDIVHCHNSELFPVSIVACYLLNKKTILTCHGVIRPDSFDKLIYKIFVENNTTSMASITYVSSSVSSHCENIGYMKSGVVIENGIDINAYSYKERSQKISRINMLRRVTVGSVGRLCNEKSYDTLIKAATAVLEINNNVDFKIAGTGLLHDNLAQLIREYGISNHFKLDGLIEDVADYVRKIDIFVISSESEGLPLVLLEAMASGCVIVTTPVGEIPNILEDNVDCLMYAIHDYKLLAKLIVYLINNDNVMISMSANVVKKAAKYDIFITANKYCDLYRIN